MKKVYPGGFLLLLFLFVSFLIPKLTVAEGFWSEDLSLGWIYEYEDGWYFSEKNGFFWSESIAEDSFYMYSMRWGWLWSRRDAQPYFWSFDWRTWYSHERTNNGEGIVFDHWANTWIGSQDSAVDRLELRSGAVMNHVQSCIEKFTTRRENTPSEYPNYTAAGGRYGTWQLRSASWWASGFFPALLWINAAYTEESEALEVAEKWTLALFGEIHDTSHVYDIGFSIGLPFRRAYDFTGEEKYLTGNLDAALEFEERYEEKVRAFRHWTFGKFGVAPNFTVIIDSLMNMELLYWAGNNGGDPQLAAKAEQHALTVGENLVRESGSTFHYNIFNENNGELLEQGTHQGYSNESTWSRGQAWAVYGFTMAYRETENLQLLELARSTAEYYLSQLPSDLIPPSDFDDPVGIEIAAKDSSAAAVAASALWMLSNLDPLDDNRDRFYKAAVDILLRLTHPDYLSIETESEAILLQGSSKYGNHEMGTTFGDYYFVEALLRIISVID